MGQAVSPRALSTLIASVYDCALDPERWEQTLAGIRDALDCHNAALSLSDLGSTILISKSVGIEPYWMARMMQYKTELQATMAEILASWPSLDEPLIVTRHLPAAYVEHSPYFQECVRAAGVVDIMQYFLIQTPKRLASFSVARHERQGVITEREIELGGLLLPHIRRAVTISNVLDARTIEAARMAEALDALRCGVVLTDARGAILHANRSAEHMLHNGSPIYDVHGTLQAKTPEAAKELRTAIRIAARDEMGIGKMGLAIRLTEADAPSVFAHVLPMTGGDMRTRLQPEAVAAVFVGPAPDEQYGADAVAALFELTRAETRVLASLLAGRTLAETAAALGIAFTTAKSHLENIFAKTGVSRQAELMRLATSAIPPARPTA